MCGEIRRGSMNSQGGRKGRAWKPLVLGACVCDCLLVKKLVKKELNHTDKKQVD